MDLPLHLRHPAACTLELLDLKLKSWHRAKYGDRPVKTAATFAKMIEEVGELAEAINAFHSPVSLDGKGVDLEARRLAILEELADIAIVCHHLARGYGGSLPDAMLGKLQVIYDRLYARPLEQQLRDDGIMGKPIGARTDPSHHTGELPKVPLTVEGGTRVVEAPLSPTWTREELRGTD